MEAAEKIRVLMTRHPIDLHNRGYKVVSTALREAGFEVILTVSGRAREVVEMAIQEDVDFIGYSLLSGAPALIIPKIVNLLKEKGGGHIKVVLGGIVPPADIPKLKEAGVAEVYGPGTRLEDVITFMRENCHRRAQ